MANLDFSKNTYSDTTAQMRAIEDYISLVSPSDTPLLALFGLKTTAERLKNWPSTSVEWLHDELMPTADQLDGSVASTVTALTVDDASVFDVGDILLLGTEYMHATAVSKSTQVVTVVRGVGGTTAASAADNAALTVITNARLEGAANDLSSYFDIANGQNYTQVIHESVSVSGSGQMVTQYGIADEVEYQMMKKVKEANIHLEKALIRGKRAAGSATAVRMMGGLDYFINSTGGNTLDGAALTQADIEDVMEMCYADSATVPDVALANLAEIQKIKNFYDSSSFLRVERTETTVGMTIQTVVTPFGELKLLMDRHCPAGTIYLINSEHFIPLVARPFAEGEISRTGDAIVKDLIGEFTCVVRQPLKAHGAIITITS